LRVHHYKLDEALCHLSGLNGFLNFRHKKK
jgi:hypothetical protein